MMVTTGEALKGPMVTTIISGGLGAKKGDVSKSLGDSLI